LVSLIVCALGFLIDVQASSAMDQALWVWPDATSGTPITDPAGRKALVTNASASGVTALFVSVYHSTKNSAGRYMLDDVALNDLVLQAHANKMKVWAEYGDPAWTTNACSNDSFPLLRMAEVIAYNAAYPSAKFDGVVLDIEPSPSPTPTPIATPTGCVPAGSGPPAQQLRPLLATYGCIIRKVRPLPVSVAINAFWNNYIALKPHHGKPFYEWVIDAPFEYVVVMGYRNTVGANDGVSDGIACLDGPAIDYWINCPSMGSKGCPNGRSGSILAGLETGASQPRNVTFFNLGQTSMNQAASEVQTLFPNGGLGGFAINSYQNAYLGSSSPNWPGTNPNFPKASGARKSARRKPKVL
jgi:hypothetical protein